MADTLHAILRRCEREPAIFHADQIASWPAGDLDWWTAAGVLQPLTPAASLPCLGCGDGPAREVVFLGDTAAGSAYVTCPRCGPSPVAKAALRRWRVDMERLAATVFHELVPLPRISAVGAGRLWRVGKATGQSGDFSVFFGRQMYRQDAAHILRKARVPPHAIVFTPMHASAPEADVAGPLILPLVTVVSYSADKIAFDHDAIVDRLTGWRDGRPQARTHSIRKRASRAAEIAALTKEMRGHLRDARDYAVCTRDRTGQPQLLPRPPQEELARRIGSRQCNVSRCLNDPEARELSFLWELAVDLERILIHAG